MTVSPSVESISETLSTLQFADRAKKVVIETTVNRHIALPQRDAQRQHDDVSIQYQNEISDLKTQLREALASANTNKPASLSQRQHRPHRDESANSSELQNTVDQLQKENAELRELLSLATGTSLEQIPNLVRDDCDSVCFPIQNQCITFVLHVWQKTYLTQLEVSSQHTKEAAESDTLATMGSEGSLRKLF